ncbi:MAG: DUF512 domain-containing protein [bacterium]
MKKPGLRVMSIDGPCGKHLPVAPGDRVVEVDGHPVADELDFRFYAGGRRAELEIVRGSDGRRQSVRVSEPAVRALTFEAMAPARCRNRCLFCFVDQLPAGLRRSLYVKDEDYRFSFLHGNFVTLASLEDAELERIIRLKLGPLYVSVHATDERVRNRLLGRKESRNILESMRALAAGGIVLHAQVVLCPGINDGEILKMTVEDLARLHPAVSSIGIVPVGLTRFRKRNRLHPLRPVSKALAVRLVDLVSEMQRAFRVKLGHPLVFLADELYLKAGRPFPPCTWYGEFPQWENGVGMVTLFERQWKEQRRRRRSRLCSRRRIAAVTGELAFPGLLPYVSWLEQARGVSLRLIPVRNRFFGRRVNVTGLLTGRDVLEQSKRGVGSEDLLLIPDVMLSRGDEPRFLDDLCLGELEQELGIAVQRFRPDPAGVEDALHRSMRKGSTRG